MFLRRDEAGCTIELFPHITVKVLFSCGTVRLSVLQPRPPERPALQSAPPSRRTCTTGACRRNTAQHSTLRAAQRTHNYARAQLTAHTTQHTVHGTQHTTTQHMQHSTQHTAHRNQHTATHMHSTQHSTQHTIAGGWQRALEDPPLWKTPESSGGTLGDGRLTWQASRACEPL